jgi:fructoselysine-6-P-deglycase FrlB-like protein
MSRKWLIFVLASILTIGMVTLAYAGDFPERDIQGIIQWGAGGSTDNIARALTPHVEKHLGKQIVLVNKPAAAAPFPRNMSSTSRRTVIRFCMGHITRNFLGC